MRCNWNVKEDVRAAFREVVFPGTQVNKALSVYLLSFRAFMAEVFGRPWSYPRIDARPFFTRAATIHEVLYAVLQGFGEGRDHQRGDDYAQPGLLCVTRRTSLAESIIP
jgi:hypothetical protein